MIKNNTIYDCFTFYNELDLLEIRLNELNSVADYFVIVEANQTQTGFPKKLYYEENKERYKLFHKKIIHIIVKDMPDIKYNNSWVLENYQRNQIVRGLIKCNDNDIIFISDLDEIPNKKDFPEIITRLTKKRTFVEKTNRIININLLYFFNLFNSPALNLKNKIFRKINRTIERVFPNKNIVELNQRWYFYYLNGDSNHSAITTRVCKYITLKKDLQCKPHNIRNIFSGNRINSGWHFTYLKGAKCMNNKLNAYTDYVVNPHKKTTYNSLVLLNENKAYIVNKITNINFVKIDNTFPEYIQQNKNKLKKYIKW